MLSEITPLGPREQVQRLREVEKLPIKADHLLKIQTLRSTLESSQASQATPKHSATQYGKFSDSEYSEFSLSPEILSEKLYDSVKMIRDLMNSNKKLKDMVTDVTQQKKNLEFENTHLQNENQELLEKVDMMESLVNSKGDKRVVTEVIQLKSEREELMKRIVQLEKENKSQTALNTGKEWAWKSKRTVMRNRRQPDTSKPLSLGGTDKGYDARISVGRVTPKAIYRPLSQDFTIDTAKQDAISTLSQILMKEYSSNIIYS